MPARRLLVFVAVLALCAGCDQATKQLAVHVLADSPGVELARGLVFFQLASNPGAFLSLGSDLPEGARRLLFLVLVPGAMAGLCLHFLRVGRGPGEPWALGLLAGGGLGNWIDRLVNDGAVTDFVSVGTGRLRTGIFNLADLAVIAGALLLLALTRQTPREP